MAKVQLTISVAYYTGTDSDGQATLDNVTAYFIDGLTDNYANIGPSNSHTAGGDLGSSVSVSRMETTADSNAWSNYKILYNSSNASSGWTEVTNLSLDIYNGAGQGLNGNYLNQWNFDAVSAQWWKLWANDGSATGVMSVRELVIYSPGFTGSFSGYTYEQGSPVSRTLYLYTRSDGTYVDATTSSGDGSYSFTTITSGAHFIVCLDDEAGDDFNDLIVGNVYPTTVSG